MNRLNSLLAPPTKSGDQLLYEQEQREATQHFGPDHFLRSRGLLETVEPDMEKHDLLIEFARSFPSEVDQFLDALPRLIRESGEDTGKISILRAYIFYLSKKLDKTTILSEAYEYLGAHKELVLKRKKTREQNSRSRNGTPEEVTDFRKSLSDDPVVFSAFLGQSLQEAAEDTDKLAALRDHAFSLSQLKSNESYRDLLLRFHEEINRYIAHLLAGSALRPLLDHGWVKDIIMVDLLYPEGTISDTRRYQLEAEWGDTRRCEASGKKLHAAMVKIIEESQKAIAAARRGKN